MSNDQFNLSLVIPAYNEENYIGTCLLYALKNSQGRFFEILVVDNGSTDKTKEVALSFPSVRVVTENEKGLTRARQRGFLETKGDIVAYVDADTYITDRWLDTIIREFSIDPEVVCISGPYIFYDVSKFHQALTKIYWLFSKPIYWITGYMVVGGNFAIRRSVLEKMNGFDTSIEFYGEDTNIARRAKKFGKVKFYPKHYVYTSARRLQAQGWVKTGIIYIKNFLSEAFLRRPATKEYQDIR